MHQVKPGMVLRGRRRTPHVALLVGTALMSLWAVGSLIALAVEIADGASGSFEYRGGSLPLWALLSASVVVAGYATRATYADWRMTGSNHGVIDYVLEPTGIRLIRQRRWARPHELLVERGETVQIDATLVYARRAGTERQYRFEVSASGGSFGFTQGIYIERLSLLPLDEVVGDIGVKVSLSGAALVIERLEDGAHSGQDPDALPVDHMSLEAPST
jgi:hypothetical protein